MPPRAAAAIPKVPITIANTMTSIPVAPFAIPLLRSPSIGRDMLGVKPQTSYDLVMFLVSLVFVGRHCDGGEHQRQPSEYQSLY